MRYIIPAAVFAVLVGFFWIGLSKDPSEVPSPFIGKPAPVFQLTELRDPEKLVSQADLSGRPTVLNVWATWCVGCRQEHEALMQLAAMDIVPIYGLNYRDNREQALQWLARLGDPYIATGYDPDGAAGLDWGVYGAPETFLIDPQGTVVYKHLGPMTLRIWQDEFMPRINSMAGDQG
ncbi:MAG: DsbE family thiol:disulfide interchange protein [Chromatiales bacterium]|jgi:cytochrome c biogenesis protein CcmG/thiol:disulfide interchange protein DsbE|nr:DsbE family thiol:disulfide interchange protein [Chromatiales bacterium]MDH4029893.1 DsbE family thiol:disulfide interchange protein [Chromatiales bacterium]